MSSTTSWSREWPLTAQRRHPARSLAPITDLELRRYGRALISQHLEVEERAVLLAAEDVGIARASARHPAVDSKPDRQCRVEFDMVGDLRSIDAEDPADGSAREDATVAHQVIGGAIGEENVEGDLVDAGFLAADRLGDLGQFAGRRHTPASAMK